jgi:hypothetical protein
MEIALVQKFFVYFLSTETCKVEDFIEIACVPQLIALKTPARSAHTCFRELLCCLFPIVAIRGGLETRH